MSASHPVHQSLSVLREIMEREKRRGGAYVAIQEESLALLQEAPGRFSGFVRAAMPTISNLDDAPSMRGALSDSSLSHSQVAAPAWLTGAKEEVSPKEPSKPERHERTEEWVRGELNQIFRDVKSCERCRGLGTLHERVVFATGNPMADVMLVGDAPGDLEEREKKPLVGPAGDKMSQILKAMGFDRESVYWSNVVKFRPKKGDGRFQGNSDRKPDATEMEACLPFIRREVEAVAPKVVVALGGTAAEGLLERGGAIADFRGEVHEFMGVPVVVTYHPSFLLRQESEADPATAKQAKRKVWEDMLRVMDLLKMDVSEKQRGFFL